MANILGTPTLTIVEHNPQMTVLKLTGRVQFVASDKGKKFRLDAELYGMDVPPDPNDHLLHFGTKLYPDLTPSNIESFEFVARVPNKILDEDVGTDEIRAWVRLGRFGLPVRWVGRWSNQIVHEFKPGM